MAQYRQMEANLVVKSPAGGGEFTSQSRRFIGPQSTQAKDQYGATFLGLSLLIWFQQQVYI